MLKYISTGLLVLGLSACADHGQASKADTSAAAHAADSKTAEMKAAEMKAAEMKAADMKAIDSFYDVLLTSPGNATPEDVRNTVAEDWASTPTPFGGPGAAGLITTLQGYGQLIPDLKWDRQEILQDGNRYIVRSIATGTPKGPFMGVNPPTGKSFEIMTIDIHTMENGRIASSYHIEDWITAVGQLIAE